MAKPSIPFKLPPLSDPKFVEKFRSTKDQNFITHFYECFKKLHIPDRTVHNNAKDMLKIIIQQRKEFLDKVSANTEAFTEMEEKLNNLNKEIDVKNRKLEEEKSKNGTIMFHMNGLNRQYDLLEKDNADLTKKLAISEEAVNKWINSALEDHKQVGEYKTQQEEIQKELEKEKEISKKNSDQANSAQKEIRDLIKQQKKMDHEIETLKKQLQQQQQKINEQNEEGRKSAKRPRPNFQVGFNSPTTSTANPQQQQHQQHQQQQQLHITSPPDLPSLTPPEYPNTSRAQESLKELQKFTVVHQQNHFQLPSNQANGNAINDNQLQQHLNSPLLMQKTVNQVLQSPQGILIPQQQQQQQQQQQMQQQFHHPGTVPNGSMMVMATNNRQQITPTTTVYCPQGPQQGPMQQQPQQFVQQQYQQQHPQQQQQQQQQQQPQQLQQHQPQPQPHQLQQPQKHVHITQQISQQMQTQSQKTHALQQQHHHHQQQQQKQTQPKNQQSPQQQREQRQNEVINQVVQQNRVPLSSPQSAFMVPPQNMQIPPQPQIYNQQQHIQGGHHSRPGQSKTPLGPPQNMQIPLQAQNHPPQILNNHQQLQQVQQIQNGQQQQYPPISGNANNAPQNMQIPAPTTEVLFHLNQYFHSLPPNERNQILNAAGFNLVNPPVIEISH